ncbi:unnamed protein product, partial [Iphiclides podalirius]
MEVDRLARVILMSAAVIIAVGKTVSCQKYNTESADMCRMFAKNPYFDPELVVGKPWRIYYTWNVKLGSKCLDVIYRNATKEIIQRFWSEMNEYLEYQPNWNAAALLLTLRSPQHEILLFANQGPAGSFIGLPNVIRDGNPLPKMVFLTKFHMKLIRNGKYLVMMDCKMGAATLSSRVRKSPPSMVDLASLSVELRLGEGHHACMTEMAKNDNDRFFA